MKKSTDVCIEVEVVEVECPEALEALLSSLEIIRKHIQEAP